MLAWHRVESDSNNVPMGLPLANLHHDEVYEKPAALGSRLQTTFTTREAGTENTHHLYSLSYSRFAAGMILRH